jgi:hypothetical protein
LIWMSWQTIPEVTCISIQIFNVFFHLFSQRKCQQINAHF